MTRALLATLLLSGLVAAQVKPKEPELPPTEFPKIEVKLFGRKPPEGPNGQEPTKEQLEAFKRAWAEFEKQLAPPALPKVADTDKPLARLGKAKLGTVTDLQGRLLARLHGGVSSGSDLGTILGATEALTAAADLAFDEPARRLPWYEHRVRLAKYLELYYFERTGGAGSDGVRGVEPPHVRLLASAARLDAEIALLKLTEHIGK